MTEQAHVPVEEGQVETIANAAAATEDTPAAAAGEPQATDQPAGQDAAPADQPKPDGDETHVVRRMKRFMGRAAEAEAERDIYKAKYEEALRQMQAGAPGAQPAEPVREQFASDEEYIAARVRHETAAMEQRIAAQFVQQQAGATLPQKVEAARAAHRDYDEVMDNARYDIRNFQTLMQVPLVAQSQHSAEIAYEVAKDPDFANRLINQMPMDAAAYEIGRIAAKVEGRKTSSAGAPSKAPPPIKPVSTRGSAAPADDNKLSDGEWWRREQERRLKRR